MASRLPVGRWEERLSRWGAPVTYVGAVVMVGLTLVAVITRSPDTKANYQESAESYHRTALAQIGANSPFLGLRRDVLGTGEPARQFVQAGCANCHGLRGEGAAVGPPIWKLNVDTITKTVREGSVGMPAFASDRLSDAQIASLAAYLNDWRKQHPDDPETKPARAGEAAPTAPAHR